MKALLTGASAISTAINSIARRGKGLDNDIQHAALSILMHVDGCGDTTLADKLVNALPKGARRLALVEWFVNYGKMSVLDRSIEADKARMADGSIFKFAKGKTTNQDEATLKPWHEMRKEAEASTVFDAHSAMSNMLARIKSASKNGLTIEGKAEALAQLDELRATLSA